MAAQPRSRAQKLMRGPTQPGSRQLRTQVSPIGTVYEWLMCNQIRDTESGFDGYDPGYDLSRFGQSSQGRQ